MKRKLLIILFGSLYFIHVSNAQIGWEPITIPNHKKVFLGLCYSLSPDFQQSPYTVSPYYVADYNYSATPFPTITIYRQGNMGMRQLTTNFESAGIKCRFNLLEFSPISSLAISCNPTLGLGFTLIEEASPGLIDGGATGYGSINIPLMIEFSYGGGATRITREDYGIFADAGVEFTQSPLIKRTIPAQLVMDENGNSYYFNLAYHWIEPVAGLGVRYHDKKNRLREIYLKYGMGASSLFIGPTGYYPVSGHPWTFKLTFVCNPGK